MFMNCPRFADSGVAIDTGRRADSNCCQAERNQDTMNFGSRRRWGIETAWGSRRFQRTVRRAQDTGGVNMIAIQRILLPTDFSEHSKHAARYACTLAEKFQSELHVVHVLQDLVALVPEAGLAFPPPGDYLQDLKSSAEHALSEFPPADMRGKIPVHRALLDGVPFVEIVRYAREREMHLIVMGTHGRTGLAPVLLGSSAEKVVRKASCPVLTVRPPGQEFHMP
jgi:nucleotide-binding universal stress UspA family protein